MNYNISAYSVFLLFMIFIIIVVGRSFHNNGRVFIIALFKNNIEQADNVNNILLVAYYLFNIGYAFVTLRFWPTLLSWHDLLVSVSVNMSLLIFILAITHYFNMVVIYFLSKSKSISITSKPYQS